MAKSPLTTEERFWSKVDKSSDCWLWTAQRGHFGHGVFKVDGRGESAHRVAWQLERGAIPAGLCVCHRCDNPPCVNPDHLFLGTKKQNSEDMVRKGRQARGERNGTRLHPESRARGERHGTHTRPERVAHGERAGGAKLTADAVLAIRRLADDGTPVAEIAERFGVTPQNIRFITRRATWRHLKEA